MRPGERGLHTRILASLDGFEATVSNLPGISDRDRREAFVQQLIASMRGRRYIEVTLGRPISPLRAQPESPLFDPIKAAIFHARAGRLDEAYWLAFLSTHFGRHRTLGWHYLAAVYGGSRRGPTWDWTAVSRDPSRFARWVADNAVTIKSAGGGFGNHRKYERLAATGEVVSSYVTWVGPGGSQQRRFREVIAPALGDPLEGFDLLYVSLSQVISFGRTARFDLLTLLSRLQLLPIAPPRAYLQGATGPLTGAKLLFDTIPATPRMLEARLIELDHHLHVGADILEDALCNWQKSPDVFMPFRG
jgi:hypothetical protein